MGFPRLPASLRPSLDQRRPHFADAHNLTAKQARQQSMGGGSVGQAGGSS